MKVLVFGDSNADDYLRCAEKHISHSISIDYNPGLAYYTDPVHYEFLLGTAIAEDDYDVIVISCHTNDLSHGITEKQLTESERAIRRFITEKSGNSAEIVLFVGPKASDIDTTRASKRSDGIHYDDAARLKIGLQIDQLLKK